MYTKEVYSKFFGEGIITEFYKDGVCIACREDSGPIKFYRRYSYLYDPITRAKGYRYWKKHFPNKSYWSIPEILAEATDLEAECKCSKGGCSYYG